MKKRFTFFALSILVFANFNPVFAIDDGKTKAQEQHVSAQKTGENATLSADDLRKTYQKVTDEQILIDALECLKGTVGDFSRNAILGDNLTGYPIKILFQDLATINPQYATFDALGWKRKNKLFIYVNPKHHDAPKEALASLLSHEALHQDEYNSINEETYAWTLESAVWTQFVDDKPELNNISHPLVNRENLIKQLFIRGDYSDKYIKKSIISNPGYQNLPSRSPGFEDTL